MGSSSNSYLAIALCWIFYPMHVTTNISPITGPGCVVIVVVLVVVVVGGAVVVLVLLSNKFIMWL